jgi:hypothetical protein
MSRTRNSLVVTVGAAAGLFLGALATSATAAADTAVPAGPTPSLPGILGQMVGAPTNLPQQLLQSTTSALTGGPAMPAAGAPANVPQAVVPGAAAASAPPGGLSSFPGSGDLSGMLPMLMPNLGSAPTPIAGSPAAPGTAWPAGPATVPQQTIPATTPSIVGLP